MRFGIQGRKSRSVSQVSRELTALIVIALWLNCWVGSLSQARERICINEGWRFTRDDPTNLSVRLCYDEWNFQEVKRFDAEADGNLLINAMGKAAVTNLPLFALKPWVLPTGNAFLKDPARRVNRPQEEPTLTIPYVLSEFDDSHWQLVDLPHDWAIEGPFNKSGNAAMGRLPTAGVGWYRKTLFLPAADAAKKIYLEFEGVMSYAAVWVNGRIVGGWPYGYATWRLDITPFVKFGSNNTVAVRVDNPPDSSRWYPGAGVYRNVWLIKTTPVHIAHWGTFITTPKVSRKQAIVNVQVTLENDTAVDVEVTLITKIYRAGEHGLPVGQAVATTRPVQVIVPAQSNVVVESQVTLEKPRLWGPPPTQKPNLYVAVTKVIQRAVVIDQDETVFGIRAIRFDPDQGVFVNGERVPIRGVNLHHDLGPLGAAFNRRAVERQLQILREMGCNAIRTAHNPPAPELLELCDQMGFLVLNETFDVWYRGKTPYDFHLIFGDWHEQDLRAHVRRDRNHPCVFIWSIGNEVGEQYTGEAGAVVAKHLVEIVREEDPTRPITTAMNWAKPEMPLPKVVDIIGLNYQGEGVRFGDAYADLTGYRCAPQYTAFRKAFPQKMIISTETAAAVSTRGTYLFPVYEGVSAPVKDGLGGDPQTGYVSAYELYTAPFGSSADRVFATLDSHPFVAGEFVWSGWDYLGEPTPYYSSRSSYFGIIDLAGFKKDRFYLYQSRWRPNLPMVHILPHWTWPERVGLVTPVHVFTTGDEVELFLNGRSLGRKKKGPLEYRLRWEDVVYEPGVLEAVAYRNGSLWARTEVRTAGAPVAVKLEPDRKVIVADGKDLCFVTVRVVDQNGITVPRAANRLEFELQGPGVIVATDNGDPTSYESFKSHERAAFNGLCLAIVRGLKNQPGTLILRVRSSGLEPAQVKIRTVAPASHPR